VTAGRSLADRQGAERRELLKMLRAFLDGKSEYDALYKNFYFHYADDLQGDALSDADWDTFGAIHEKMDFVAEDPDAASRRDGWVSSEEYRKWLRKFLESRLGDEESRSSRG
jgi:hypothetical protein